ncbi:transposase [Streptomyces buecherae]|uniref:IS701 family transposase n=1 Tax=Streptomyces buecherae TaxID=2763006 RepID=UPI0036A032CC
MAGNRRLYLPEHSWCTDSERRQAAGIPDEVRFATKPRLAWEMIAAALDARGGSTVGDRRRGVRTGPAASCRPGGPRDWLRSGRRLLYRVRINSGRTPIRADTVADRLPEAAWHRQNAGAGAKGLRYYDWAWIHIGTGEHRHLLIRRNPTTRELAFYLCWSPTAAPLAELVRVAGNRWSVEECFQAAKGQVGLDHHQVRNWTSWHRHVTLAMLALAFLATVAADAAPDQPADPLTTPGAATRSR